MTIAKPLPGSKYRLYLSDGTTNANRFDNGFVCLATDLDWERSTEYEEFPQYDCDNPSAPATNTSIPRLLKTAASFGGVVSAKKIQIIETIWEDQTLQEWRIIYDETLADGGETHTGVAYIEELKMSKQNAGVAKFTCKLKAQGIFARADVA